MFCLYSHKQFLLHKTTHTMLPVLHQNRFYMFVVSIFSFEFNSSVWFFRYSSSAPRICTTIIRKRVWYLHVSTERHNVTAVEHTKRWSELRAPLLTMRNMTIDDVPESIVSRARSFSHTQNAHTHSNHTYVLLGLSEYVSGKRRIENTHTHKHTLETRKSRRRIKKAELCYLNEIMCECGVFSSTTLAAAAGVASSSSRIFYALFLWRRFAVACTAPSKI